MYRLITKNEENNTKVRKRKNNNLARTPFFFPFFCFLFFISPFTIKVNTHTQKKLPQYTVLNFFFHFFFITFTSHSILSSPKCQVGYPHPVILVTLDFPRYTPHFPGKKNSFPFTFSLVPSFPWVSAVRFEE